MRSLPRHWPSPDAARTGLLAAAKCAAQFLFGLMLGTADVTVIYAAPAGAWRTVVWVVALSISAVAIVAMNRAVSIARGRRPRWHRRDLSTRSQGRNLSNRVLNRQTGPVTRRWPR